MIKSDHWAWVEMGLDETISLRINFNVLKNTKKKKTKKKANINTKKKSKSKCNTDFN